MLIFETRLQVQETSLEKMSIAANLTASNFMQGVSTVGEAITAFNAAAREYRAMVASGKFLKLDDKTQCDILTYLSYAFSSLKLGGKGSELEEVKVPQGKTQIALDALLDATKDYFIYCTKNTCYKISSGLTDIFTTELGISEITKQWHASIKEKAHKGDANAAKTLDRFNVLSGLQSYISDGKYATASEAIAETNKLLAEKGCIPLTAETEKIVREAHELSSNRVSVGEASYNSTKTQVVSAASADESPLGTEKLFAIARKRIDELNSSANIFLAALEMKKGEKLALASNALAFQSAAMFSALVLPQALRAQEAQRMLYAPSKVDEKSETPGQKTVKDLAAKANNPAETVVSEATALALMGMAAYYAQELVVSSYVPPAAVDYDSKAQPPKFGGVFIPAQPALAAKAKAGASAEFANPQSFAPELAVASAAFGNDRMLRNAVPPERKKSMAKFNAPAAIVSEQFSNYMATGSMDHAAVTSSLSSIDRMSAEAGIPAFNSEQTISFYSAMRQAVSNYVGESGGAERFMASDGSVDHEKLVELAKMAEFKQKVGAYALASAGFEPMKTVRIGKKA